MDVAGAQFSINNPDAGTLTATSSSVCFEGTGVQISATPNGNSNVPAGYQTIYVLTSGAGLVIEQVSLTPDFIVNGSGLYTIHTLVYDPLTLDLTIVVPGQTTGFDVNGLLVQGGGTICASLDVAGAPVTISNPDAGTITADNGSICGASGSALLTATPDNNANVPAGYQVIYVLTSGSGLVIEQVNSVPSFTVTTGGNYTIHTLVYDPATLDLSIVVPGQTTGFDVNGLLVQGGGTICASLDVAGAPFAIETPSAGSLTATALYACFSGNSATLSATANGNAVVPAGYQTIYVLTSGSGLVIEQVNTTPDFTVNAPGLYTIHTLVYNPATLDLNIVVPGQTTGFDVNSLLVQGGGSICASLDVAGAPITVGNPDAGAITPDDFIVCLDNGSAFIQGIPQGNAVVPPGFNTIYVLTRGFGLTIQQVNTTPDFTVTQQGLYRIHTLVYDPATLDLTTVVFGQTTGNDVNGLLIQGGGSICASLDVQGAPFLVFGPIICNIFNLNAVSQNDLSAQTIEELKTLAESPVSSAVVINSIYPNPANDMVSLNISLMQNENVKVMVFNMTGQRVIEQNVTGTAGEFVRTLDVSSLSQEPTWFVLKQHQVAHSNC
ncbi:MAG: T9SS type A sorting domain-containing protein [Bacteroidetes bacterium]|nr:T9SS type A sorting domain-containing protein [Bacteroidota bacterium]